jgi:DNA-binding CsgD family transcriptional regulator
MPETYAQLYGLTLGEARVAHQLVLGRSPRDAAAELGIGVETVRTHVKNILPKVGCHRQVELVRRLVTGAGALTR